MKNLLPIDIAYRLFRVCGHNWEQNPTIDVVTGGISNFGKLMFTFKMKDKPNHIVSWNILLLDKDDVAKKAQEAVDNYKELIYEMFRDS